MTSDTQPSSALEQAREAAAAQQCPRGHESERVLAIARLVDQVQRVVAESGRSAGFDASRWTAEWLDEPNAALGGRPPSGYLDTEDGRARVSALIAQMQSGAYA